MATTRGAEETPLLLPEVTKPQACDPRKAQLALQGVFGLVFAAGNTLIFLKPSQNYGEQESFGIQLSKLLGIPSWPLFFASSATDFGLTSLYLSAMSIPAYLSFIKKDPRIVMKVLKGGGIVILTATQNVQPALITISSGASPLIIAAATIGEFPRNLYSVMNFIEMEMPGWGSKLKKSITMAQAYLSPQRFISPEERAKKHFLYKLSQVQKEFVSRIQEGGVSNFDHVPNRLNNQNAKDFENTWLQMLENINTKDSLNESVSSQMIRNVIRGIGVGSAVNILFPIWLNAHKIFSDKVGDELGWFLAMSTSVSATYFFNKFNIFGFEVAYDGLKNVIQKKPIDNLSFKFMPKTMIVATLSSFLISLLSYPTILDLFRRNYFGAYKDELAMSLVFFINLNHTIGLIKLTNLAIISYMRANSSAQRDKIVFDFNEARLAAEKIGQFSHAEEFFNLIADKTEAEKKILVGELGKELLNKLVIKNNQSLFFAPAQPTFIVASVNPDGAESLSQDDVVEPVVSESAKRSGGWCVLV